MSPGGEGYIPLAKCFPRVSGDEPAVDQVDLLGVEFSPRERG